MNSTKFNAVSLSSNSGDMRATMKMPAVTMVAAWISAEIGVRPSIESGSHTCSGTCADLPIAPTNRQLQIAADLDHPWSEMNTNPCPPPITPLTLAKTVSYPRVPNQDTPPAMPAQNTNSANRM